MSDERKVVSLLAKKTVIKDETGEWWEVPNQILKDISEALGELGSRRLETRKNQTRVVTLQRRWFDDPMEIIKETINDICEATPAPEGWDEAALPIAVNEERQRQLRAFLRQTQRIKPIPKDA